MEKWQVVAPPYDRKFQGRLETIKDTSFDLYESTILDLGCGEGDFVAGLAPFCKHIFGVNNNPEELIKAHSKVKQYDNVTLIEADIHTALQHLPKVNITLFLSVLHHVLSDNSYYTQGVTGLGHALVLMNLIREKTDVLYFEMGMPYEPRVWASRIGKLDQETIRRTFLEGCGFTRVIDFYPPEVMYDGFALQFRNNLQTFLHDNLYHPLSRSPKWIQKALKFDNRDKRPFFLAR